MSYTRRRFLQGSLGALALSPAMPWFLARAAGAAMSDPGDGKVLVVVQLTGGNDGLNTVVPYAEDAYARARDTLRLTAGEVHKIDERLGFHPKLDALARQFHEGRASILQGVGFVRSSRDHEVALHEWHTGRPDDRLCQTGWLGRTADLEGRSPADVPVVFVSPIPRPAALAGAKRNVPAIRTLDDWTLRRPLPAQPVAAVGSDEKNDLLAFARERTAAAAHVAERVRRIAAELPSGGYPDVQLASDLRTIAALIRADLGVRIFFTELGGGGLGGFDNHAGQRDNHASLLDQLSQSVTAFIDDLARDRLLDRVLLMTFSEFGRTVAENGRRGTDHGAAAPVLLAGGKLRGGLVGEHPSLTDLDQGGLKPSIDFRRLYATVLGSWLELDSDAILGERFSPLDFLA